MKGIKGHINQYGKDIKKKSGLFILPGFVGVSLFFFIPFLVVIYYSFISDPITKEFVWFENFVEVITNQAFVLAVKNTFSFSFIAVPLAVILSLLTAFALDKSIPGKSKIRTALLSPMMVPIASIILIWQVLFHYNGFANDMLEFFGQDKIDWFKSSYAKVVIILLFIWKNLGYNMILFMAALANIPKEMTEVAKLESASSWQIFWKIKVRYLSPTILFVTIFSLINSFKIFREVYLLTGDYPYDSLYMLQHFMNNTFRALDYQRLSAAAIIMCIFMILLISALFYIENHVGKDLES